MSSPTNRLLEEHKLIERMLAVYNQAVEKLEGGDFQKELITALGEFCQDFIDLYHFAKEENIWYKAFLRNIPPDANGPVELMLSEHSRIRRYNSEIIKAVESCENKPAQAVAAIQENGRLYVETLSNHIYKEETILFVMAADIFTPEVEMTVGSEFAMMDFELEVKEPLSHFSARLDAIEKLMISGE